MKKINQLNQYLLERYPTIWNTRICWMLLISLVIHFVFFIIGYISHSDPVSLHRDRVSEDYFRNGLIFIHLIISVLLIVGWLIVMFRNNAFKNFYPVSPIQLFLQFVQYFIILFFAITFYFSYMFGFQCYIINNYSDADMKKDIDIVNRANPFLSQEIEYYMLDQRLYPSVFSQLYCERNSTNIDHSQKYFTYENRQFQFYSVYEKKVTTKDRYGDYALPEPEKSKEIQPISTFRNTNSITYYFKKQVVDPSEYIYTSDPSYYNFSNVFYQQRSQEDFYNDQYGYDNHFNNINRKQAIAINTKTAELLNRKNPKEIKELLSQFLQVSKKYKIANNLSTDNWYNLIYNPNNFKVKKFIKKYNNIDGSPYDPYSNQNYYQEPTIQAATTVQQDNNGRDVIGDYFKTNLTPYYYTTYQLKNLLYNVDDIKTTDFVGDSLHIFLWIAFALSVLIFSFRVTSLRSLLFAIISAGVLALIIALVSVVYGFTFNYSNEFFVAYLIFIVALIILLAPILFLKNLSKLIASIFINISMIGFVLFVLLVIGIISLHQQEKCSGIMDYQVHCPNIFDDWGTQTISYFILFCGFLFLFLYTRILLKWKSLPQ